MYSKNLQIIKNELYIGKYRLLDLAKEYGTPLYVYDENDIIEKLNDYQTLFSSQLFQAKIVYASKAFLVPELVKILSQKKILMDAMSITDMEIAKMADYSMNDIVFHGNFKSDEELKYALTAGIGYIVVDNLDELKRLINLSKKEQKVINTLFRINPQIDAHTHQYIQTAQNASKFGENIDDSMTIKKVMQLYLENENVKLLGFHAHIGSQIKEIEPYELLVKKLLEFSQKTSNNYGIKFTTINFGGGFGIDYLKKDQGLNATSIVSKLIKVIEKEMKNLNFYLQEVMIEPGRSIVGPAGMTLYECGIVKKTTGDKNFLFINGGMTDNIRPALYNAQYEADIVNKMNEAPCLKVDIVGKCCESGDFIIKDALLPNVHKEDILVVYATGAYTYSMNVQYNGHLKPAVIFVGDKVKIVSKRQTINNIKELFKTK